MSDPRRRFIYPAQPSMFSAKYQSYDILDAMKTQVVLSFLQRKLEATECDALCYFPVISDRKVTKGTPLKEEVSKNQKAASRSLIFLNISPLRIPLSPSALRVSEFRAVRLNFLMWLFRSFKPDVILRCSHTLVLRKGKGVDDCPFTDVRRFFRKQS